MENVKRNNRTNDNESKCVYIMYNNLGSCLYVGISNNFDVRIKQHLKDKTWFDEVDNIKISDYMNANESKIYEIYYISKLNPVYNKDHAKYTNGFSMNVCELDFNEYDYKAIKASVRTKHRDSIILGGLIDSFCTYLSDKDSGIYNLTFYLMRKLAIDNNIELEDEELCKYFSTVMNRCESKGLISGIHGSGYNTYVPIGKLSEMEAMTQKVAEEIRNDNSMDSEQKYREDDCHMSYYDAVIQSVYNAYEKINIDRTNLDNIDIGFYYRRYKRELLEMRIDQDYIKNGYKLIDCTIKR